MQRNAAALSIARIFDIRIEQRALGFVQPLDALVSGGLPERGEKQRPRAAGSFLPPTIVICRGGDGQFAVRKEDSADMKSPAFRDRRSGDVAHRMFRHLADRSPHPNSD